MTINVLVVDDSALIRDVLSKALNADADIKVVGTAEDPIEAREKIKTLNPDVLTLDIEMPNMNGLAFLEKLMRLRPMPVVMVSTLTKRGAEETLLALELGAVDFVAKPGNSVVTGIVEFGAEVCGKVKAAAASNARSRGMRQAPAPVVPLRTAAAPPGSLIAIGASTGGVEAIRAVLAGIPADAPPIVVAQHMPTGFTSRFAQRLDEQVALKVVEAADRMPVEPGHVYIAKGDYHLRIAKGGNGYVCRLAQDEEVSGHRPSVDALFESVAKVAGSLAVGAILTGMGRDGARGLKMMRDAGAFTVGQSQSSALVYGMPRVAFEEGAVSEQAPVEAIAGKLVNAVIKRAPAA